MPACSASRAPDASYAVTITIFSPRAFRSASSSRVSLPRFHLSSPSRTTLSIKRVSPRARLPRARSRRRGRRARRTPAPVRSTPDELRSQGRRPLRALTVRLRALEAAQALARAPRPTGRRCARTAPGRPGRARWGGREAWTSRFRSRTMRRKHGCLLRVLLSEERDVGPHDVEQLAGRPSPRRENDRAEPRLRRPAARRPPRWRSLPDTWTSTVGHEEDVDSRVSGELARLALRSVGSAPDRRLRRTARD